MNTNDWTEVPLKLKASGFTVHYERISYDPANPLWRAKALRGEQEWNTLGRDLKSALVALDTQTTQLTDNSRQMSKVA
jgi:hypothetical protein